MEETPGPRRVSFTDVSGGYELTAGGFLVQAVGSCDGVDFYFGAKYGKWEFETQGEAGHAFPPGHPNAFVRTGQFDEAKPGVMTREWGVGLLRKCLDELWGRGAVH